MRKIAVLNILLTLPLAMAFAVEVGPLSSSEYADTEVSSNFTFAVGEGGGRRLVFSVELPASPSNNVEVAVGHDTDCNGRLSLDEAALRLQ